MSFSIPLTTAQRAFLLGTTAVAALAMSACLWGVVTDADTGAGIEGAVVTIEDANGKAYTATTDEAGIYVISPQTTGSIPPVGTVTAKVEAEGYDGYSNYRGVTYQDGLLGGWPSDKEDFQLARTWEHIEYKADLQVTAHEVSDYWGACWAADIKNNGPETIDYSIIELSYSYSETDLGTGQIGFANGSQQVTLVDFSPGSSIHICPFGTSPGHQYVGSFTISGVDIEDPESSNNSVDWDYATE